MSVCVLMSSYQGEKYIEAQIESVLSQTYSDLELYIRDDGSTDSTKSLLSKYRLNKRVHLIEGKNIGVTMSFWTLVNSAPKADFYSFCDQDDVWFNTKLEKATLLIGKSNIPTLYIGNVELVDENLNKLHREANLLSSESFKPENSIVPRGDRVLGCTMVWNWALQKIIKEKHIKAYYAHDQQVFFLACMLGKVVFDSRPSMYYRQHSNNVAATGTFQGKVRQYKKNVRSAIRRLHSKNNDVVHEIEIRNCELLDLCGDMISPNYIRLLKLSCEANNSIKARILLLKEDCCKGMIFRKKVRILFGKL